jgi:hypothetical protein
MTRRHFVESSLVTATSARAPRGEFDYVDWSWDRWRAITGSQRPTMVGEQSGKAELIELASRK